MSVDAAVELEVWKRVVKGSMGDIVYATMERIVARELAKIRADQV